MYFLSVKDHFDAAHRLPFHQGKCQNIHGHRWDVEVVVGSPKTNENGLVLDFGVLKDLLAGVVLRLDHRYLNEVCDFVPTAENLARFLFEAMSEKLGQYDTVFTHSVRVNETPTSTATYWGRDADKRDFPVDSGGGCERRYSGGLCEDAGL